MDRKRKFSEIDEKYKKYKMEDKSIKRLYDKIKEEYINDKDLDITLEKIYLKKELEKYSGETIKKYDNLIWIFATIIFTLIIEKGFEEEYNLIVIALTLFIILIIVISIWWCIDRNKIKLENDEYIYFSVCLEVIKDIENKKHLE